MGSMKTVAISARVSIMIVSACWGQTLNCCGSSVVDWLLFIANWRLLSFLVESWQSFESSTCRGENFLLLIVETSSVAYSVAEMHAVVHSLSKTDCCCWIVKLSYSINSSVIKHWATTCQRPHGTDRAAEPRNKPSVRRCDCIVIRHVHQPL